MKKYWSLKETNQLFKKPFLDLLFEAQTIHRKNFHPLKLQISTLLSLKTGGCPEDCKYCPQSARYKTNLKNTEKTAKLGIQEVILSAKKAKQSGADRFCMGAAWKNPKDQDIPYLVEIITKIKKMGLETCMTLGSLNINQAQQLSEAGLDFYNHNLDTSPEFYNKIITTRTYQERLDTLSIVRQSGMKVCSGGILGMGETSNDRQQLLMQLANLEQQPESVPINMLVKTPGLPLEHVEEINNFDFIKTIAAARIMMPKSYVRLSAGRHQMSEEMQTMCFMAGVNSIFYGCKLLTTQNVEASQDIKFFKKIGIITDNLNINEKKENDIKYVLQQNIYKQYYNI
ncbi:biotin synthase BioB [Buchnera aphidicola (Thelaxes californica)]|uniref:Biotin synthase n=1 Tax=Buchnera aphidicola (Thelaxes californica) TaxID=1315998 RepID=A0A4D6YM25_9GAMM|nr:biotin synthase BioB [Buchnera aphidicola]QCI26758.1 biotin synthase BioB [Buchnera aphidicola (Thelaxes californica)]